jgi:hypothetical protein
MSKRERSPSKTYILDADKLELGQTYLRVGKHDYQEFLADEVPYQEVVKLIEIDKSRKYTFINTRNQEYQVYDPLRHYAYFIFNDVPWEVLSTIKKYLGGKMRKTQKSKKQGKMRKTQKSKKQYK